MILDRPYLDSLYERWNRPEYISPDPLETLTDYGNPGDREAAALTAACMAYGRVSALLPPLRRVLGVMGRHPRLYVTDRSEGDMARDLNGVVHRFARPAHLAALLAGAGAVIRRYGGLEAVFLEGRCWGRPRSSGHRPAKRSTRRSRASSRRCLTGQRLQTPAPLSAMDGAP